MTVTIPLTEAQLAEYLIAAMRQELKGKLWVDSKGAAEYLGVSIQSFYRHRKTMNLPFSLWHGITRYSVEDLDKFLKEHRTSPNTVHFKSAA